MQAPVVQLLKDPLVMLTSGSPWQKTGEGSIAVGSINTNSAYVPYGLGRSLKFVSSATGGYGSWKQSVTVVKGKSPPAHPQQPVRLHLLRPPGRSGLL